MAVNVLVTGASGQTGVHIFQKLNERRGEFSTRGLVRSKHSVEAVNKKIGKTVQSQLVLGDVRKADQLNTAFIGVHSVIIATGSQAHVKLSSLAGAALKKMVGKDAKEKYYFMEGEEPEQVDWMGTKNQIDAAKAAGVKHIILLSAMGVTRPSHPLNELAGANMLLWKRKAERYLIQSGIDYTIIHAGELLPNNPREVAPGGQRELVVGVDDQLLDWVGKNTIPREDVAEVCVKCLLSKDARNRSFDLGSLAAGEGTVWDGDIAGLMKTLKGANCKYPEPEWP